MQLGFLMAGGILPPLSVVLGWRGAVAVAAVIPPAGLLASWRLPSDRPPRTGDVADAKGPLPDEVRWLTAYSCLMGIVNAAVISFLPMYGREVFGMSLPQAGWLVSALGLVGIVGRITAAQRVGRTQRYAQGLRVMAIASACAVVGMLLAPQAGDWLLWGAVVVAGASVAAWNAVAHLTAVSLTPSEGAGRASGSVAFGFLVGFGLGPVALGYTVDLTGSYRLGWMGVASMCFAALLCLRPLRRSTRTNGGARADLR